MQEIIIRAVCQTLLHSIWQGILVAAGAAVLMLLTKRSPSAWRYHLLCALLAIFIAAVAFTFCRQVNVSLSHIVSVNPAPTFRTQLTGSRETAGLQSGFVYYAHQVLTMSAFYINKYAGLLVLLWFAVFLFHFLRLLLGLANAERMRYYKVSTVPEAWNHKLEELCGRLQIHRSVSLMESALLKVPVLIGYITPVILIPAGMLVQLTPDQVEAILLHELAHVRRHDYLVNLIQHAIDTLFFFNPAIVWVSSLIRNNVKTAVTMKQYVRPRTGNSLWKRWFLLTCTAVPSAPAHCHGQPVKDSCCNACSVLPLKKISHPGPQH